MDCLSASELSLRAREKKYALNGLGCLQVFVELLAPNFSEYNVALPVGQEMRLWSLHEVNVVCGHGQAFGGG